MKTRFYRTTSTMLLVALMGLALTTSAKTPKARHMEKAEYSMETESAVEYSLKVENWMLDDSYWNIVTEKPVENESSLDLEPWMTNDKLWKIEPVKVESNHISSNEESALDVEKWMSDDNFWKIKSNK